MYLPTVARARSMLDALDGCSGSSILLTSFSSIPICLASSLLLMPSSRMARYRAAFNDVDKGMPTIYSPACFRLGSSGDMIFNYLNKPVFPIQSASGGHGFERYRKNRGRMTVMLISHGLQG